jgi:hypothetical protein
MKICTTCGESNQDLLIKRKGKVLADCKKCAAARTKLHYETNKLKRLEYAKKYRTENRDIILEYKRVYRLENKDLVREQLSNWRINNKDHKNSLHAKRRAFKIQALPKWLTKDHLREIKNLYTLAKELTVSTGIEHHVDHIVPLINKSVCGLHIPCNLQVITKFENLSKGNKFLE